MNIQTTENLRYKLERRINWLRAIRFGAFQQALKAFWDFFDNEPMLCEIEKRLLNEFPDVSDTVIKNPNETLSMKESVAIACKFLRKFINLQYGGREFLSAVSQRNIASVSRSGLQHEIDQRNLELFRDLYLEPFYLYVDEEIDNKKAILNFIRCYKHRSEWFYQVRLQEIVKAEEEKKKSGEKKYASVEDKLAMDLYSYLYDEGINFHISPSSITGRIDLIEEGNRPLLEGQENPSHRLLADAKVFDGKSRNANYIGKGFGQILRYCKKYNEPFGYLIIYNNSDGELVFELEDTLNDISIQELNGKTIAFIVIDINKSQADSTGGKAKTYTVKKNHLLGALDSE